MRLNLSGIALAVGNTAELTLGLLRGIVLARILTPEHFGIGVTITAISAVTETISDIGLSQLAIRQKAEEAPRVLATLQSLAVLRGVILCTVLLVIGHILAGRSFFGDGTLEAFYLLAAAPVARSLANLGIKFVQRQYSFGQEAATSFTSHLMWTVVSVAIGLYTHHFICMAWGALAYAATYATMSQVLSPIKWRLGWTAPVAEEAYRFGRPLIPNGIVLAVSNAGDRLIVGGHFGPAVLALYNTSMTMISLPRSMMYRYLGAIFLPLFVNNSETEKRDTIFNIWISLISAVAVLMGLGFFLLGQIVVTIVYGAKYMPGDALTVAFAVAATVKICNLIPVTPALAFGHTRFVFYTTASAGAALLLGALTIWFFGGDIATFLLVSAAFELVFLTGIIYAIRDYAASLHAMMILFLSPAIILAVVALASHILQPSFGRNLCYVIVAFAAYLLLAIRAWRLALFKPLAMVKKFIR